MFNARHLTRFTTRNVLTYIYINNACYRKPGVVFSKSTNTYIIRTMAWKQQPTRLYLHAMSNSLFHLFAFAYTCFELDRQLRARDTPNDETVQVVLFVHISLFVHFAACVPLDYFFVWPPRENHKYVRVRTFADRTSCEAVAMCGDVVFVRTIRIIKI